MGTRAGKNGRLVTVGRMNVRSVLSLSHVSQVGWAVGGGQSGGELCRPFAIISFGATLRLGRTSAMGLQGVVAVESRKMIV